jgi:hypothetical protein
MSDQDDHPLSPSLTATELQLQSALEEVCEDTDIRRTETDELIRIEETLAAASDAAKQAISLAAQRHLKSFMARTNPNTVHASVIASSGPTVSQPAPRSMFARSASFTAVSGRAWMKG